MEHITFGSEDIENALARLDREQLDRLPFGAIQVDPEGNILEYNATEGAIVGQDPRTMIGLNFFRDVAPCADSPDFYGHFREGVERGRLNVMFEYVFERDGVGPLRVKVHLKKALHGDAYWIFVKRIHSAGDPRAGASLGRSLRERSCGRGARFVGILRDSRAPPSTTHFEPSLSWVRPARSAAGPPAGQRGA
ncbi:photoactive yellow protein [Halorhodospira neutriphila]|nr:photoactive yellow protein [Halorhodospira neutriphila]